MENITGTEKVQENVIQWLGHLPSKCVA